MKLIVVGHGLHGSRIATLAIEAGHSVVAVIDPAQAGSRIPGREQAGPALRDVSELPQKPDADVAIVTAPVDLDGLEAIAVALMTRGLDIITIHPDVFDPPLDWSARVDAVARAQGTSMLSTGVQDVWWVHMPAVAAAAMARIDAVTITHHVDLNTLAVPLAEHLGAGRPVTDFADIHDTVLAAEASVLGGPLRVLARRLGLTPGDVERVIEPLVRDTPTAWPSASRTIDPGYLVGFTETITVPTAEGVELRGTMVTSLLEPGGSTVDRVLLAGDPELHLEHRPFPGARITDVVPVARLYDIREAAPGLHTAATLHAPRYRHPGTPSETENAK